METSRRRRISTTSKRTSGLRRHDQPINNTTSFVWEIPVGRGKRWMSDSTALTDAVLGGWTIASVNTMTSGEPVNLTYTPAAAFQVSGIQQDFRGANNYRPNVVGDPYGDTTRSRTT